MISALMDVTDKRDVAVLHPSAVRGFRRSACHIQLHSSFPISFWLSFPIFVLEKTQCQMDKHTVRGPNPKLAVTEGPMFAQIYVLHQVVVVVVVGGVSRESNGRLNSISF